MQTLAQIKEILEIGCAVPKRSLGQNFLIDHNLIRKLVDASGVKAGDLVLEVGPGTGTMTEELIARECEVIACELDDHLASINTERIPKLIAEHSKARFTLVHGDCLANKHAVNVEVLKLLSGRPFALVANLPYGAGTPLMSTLLVDHPQCHTLAVTIQKEVADRLLAQAGSKDFGPLGVIAQATCIIERVANAPPECFWPRPDITSSMVLLRRRETPLTPDISGLSDFCRVIFAQRRKQLSGVLKAAGGTIDWDRLHMQTGCEHVESTVRAEQLTTQTIIALQTGLSEQGFIAPEG